MGRKLILLCLLILGSAAAFLPTTQQPIVPPALTKERVVGTSSDRQIRFRRQQQQRQATTMTADPVTEKLSVGILVFENVEVLDFTGPYEVFSRTRLQAGTAARRTEDTAPFRVFTVAAAKQETVSATGNLKVVADYTCANAPKIDILVVPGGFGTRPLLNDEETIRWIQTRAAEAKLVTSVCTGALLLAKAGLLKGRKATSHWASLEMLQEFEEVEVERTLRWVDDGDVVSSAGVAAGIDMAFHVVERLCGKEVADETAYYIEYPRRLATDPRSSTA